jgi:hypothetical protein
VTFAVGQEPLKCQVRDLISYFSAEFEKSSTVLKISYGGDGKQLEIFQLLGRRAAQ